MSFSYMMERTYQRETFYLIHPRFCWVLINEIHCCVVAQFAIGMFDIEKQYFGYMTNPRYCFNNAFLKHLNRFIIYSRKYNFIMYMSMYVYAYVMRTQKRKQIALNNRNLYLQ